MAMTSAARRFANRPEALMLAVLTAAAVVLIAAAVMGGRKAEGSLNAVAALDEGAAVAAETSESVGRAEVVEGRAVRERSAVASASPAAQRVTETGERVSVVGATREGVHADHFEVGIHAPLTFDGAPLNLAEDPVTGVKGYITYVNRHGGINGLKARIYPIDDRYTTQGGRAAADRLTKEIKPFIIEGTLGIDQVHKVALAAKAAKIPYFASGGPEPELRDIGMYQVTQNYDQHANNIVAFVCKYGKQYVGGEEVRLGTTTLNSELILPVETRLVKKLTDRKCVHTPVDSRARGTINKPTEQSTYQAQLLDLRNAYGGQGVNLIVPLQDPVTTARQVAENRPYKGPTYNPRWTFSNFAHDGDTTLALVGADWTGVRGMSGACYFHPQGGGKPYDAKLCSKMGEAHRQWVSLGEVTYDENAGGSVGGKSSYNYNEDSWTADGNGGAAGYQLVYFWNGAMKAIGTDPTREKFMAALQAYDQYSNLLTSPITFKGSANPMIGSTGFVLLEGQSNLKYRQVVQITPGLVDHF